MNLEPIAALLAELIDIDEATSLQDASEETRAAATRMYLSAIDHDVDIVINGREVRDLQLYGRTHQSLIEQELYQLAEAALEPLVAIELERLRRGLNINAAVDIAIKEMKEKAA